MINKLPRNSFLFISFPPHPTGQCAFQLKAGVDVTGLGPNLVRITLKGPFIPNPLLRLGSATNYLSKFPREFPKKYIWENR